MNRRPRRSGIKFIENDKERNLTYYKRRPCLYKSIADLNTLTSAKVAFVVEAESGKISSFGTPSSDAVIECFLSNSSPDDIHIDEEEAARITHLQDEVYRLEQVKEVEEKRAKESKARLKEVQETRIGKLLSKDVEDLTVDELKELLQKLARVEEDIAVRVNADRRLEVSAQQGDPSLPFSSTPRLPQINMPPRNLPWAPLHASSSSQHPQSPWESLPQSTWSQSSLLPPAIPPPAPAPPMYHQQQHMMPPPAANEPHQYNHYFPQQPPQSFLPQVNHDQNSAYAQNINYINPAAPAHQNQEYTPEFNFNLVAPPPAHQQHANSLNFAADGQPPHGYQWTLPSPCNENYNHHLDSLCVQLGLIDDNGGVQAAAGDQEGVPNPSDGLHQQDDDDWLSMNLWDYSPLRGDNTGDAAGN